MITREHIDRVLVDSPNTVISGRKQILNNIMELITDERNQYQELVEAATWLNDVLNGGDTGKAARAVIHAVQPFIKLSLSEKITKLIPEPLADAAWISKEDILKLAEEAKTLEQERELMKYR